MAPAGIPFVSVIGGGDWRRIDVVFPAVVWSLPSTSVGSAVSGGGDMV